MLPNYNYNAMLDFSPITNAMQTNRANAMADEKLGMEREKFGMDKQKFQTDQNTQRMQRISGQLRVLSEMPDSPQKASLGERWWGANPDIAQHAEKMGVNRADPNVWKFLAAEAGSYDLLKEAQLKHTQAAEGRASAMHGPQLQAANLDVQTKQRELETPKTTLEKVKDADGAESIVAIDPRSGKSGIVYQPQQPAAGQPRPITDPKKRAEVEHTMRSELQKLSGDYRTVRDASGNLEGLGQNATAAGDIALIYSFMKILDPGSVVRETEFATAQNAAGVPDQVRNVFNRVLNGERLNPDQRKDFLNQARTIATKQTGQYQRTIDQYKGVAERSGVDFRNVIVDQDLLSPQGRTASGNSTVGTPLNGAPAESAPVLTPDQARRAPPGTVFRSTDGRVMRVPQR